jgi:hypothetical protein
MASQPPNMYKLREGAIFSDLFPRDFADVMWQAFEKDNLESITLEISKHRGRLKLRVVEVVRKAKPP